MRLFTGLSIPQNVARSLESALVELRSRARLRWSPVENLHITTKFIGEWPETRLSELKGALDGVDAPPRFTVSVGRFGFLPNPHRPKIFLAGVHAGRELGQLAESTEAALTALGVKPEDRPYTPHLTLARIANEDITSLREGIAASPVPAFGSFEVREFHLYSSRQSPAGSVYTAIGTWALPEAAA